MSLEWSSPSLILNTRLYGETDGIATVLSLDHGLYRGLVKGMVSRKQSACWQVGNFVLAYWSARLQDQLGYLKAELIRPNFVYLSSYPLAFSIMMSLCSVVENGLLERQPVEVIASHTFQLLGFLSEISENREQEAMAHLLRWERDFLTDLGYGLDFSVCQQNDSVESYWVSPRTGKVVTEAMAGEWKPRLFRLPLLFLKEEEAGTLQDWHDGLRLTGYFLQKNVFSMLNRMLPPARISLADRIQRDLAKQDEKD